MRKKYNLMLCLVVASMMTACTSNEKPDISLSINETDVVVRTTTMAEETTEMTLESSTEAKTDNVEITVPGEPTVAESTENATIQVETTAMSTAETTTEVPTTEVPTTLAPTTSAPTQAPTQPPTQAPTEAPKPAISAEMSTKVANSMNAYGNYIQQVFNLVNERRKASGLAELQFNNTLAQVATYRCIEIIETDVFSHTRPDGTPCYTLFDQYGMVYSAAGENLAAGQMNPDEVVTDWMNSPGHRANILGDFTDIGIGVAIDKSGCLYWAQSFTKRRN